MFNLPSRHQTKYLKNGRLSDVLALIQVLALDKSTHRSEAGKDPVNPKGLQGEMQGLPSSAKTWTNIAEEHPEFFRVNAEKNSSVSLVGRHVIPKNPDGVRELPPELIGKFMELAVNLHDRQVKLAERWTYLVPIWVAVIAGIVKLIEVWLR